MRKVTGILSMLHEPAGAGMDSATRVFRGDSVLAWTLSRLIRTRKLDSLAILCWDEQSQAAGEIAILHGARVISRGPRTVIPQIESIAAARRWADGWRGGLIGTCEFDRGFYGPWVSEICDLDGAGAVMLLDPAAGLVDPALVDHVVEHANDHPNIEICFSQAAPGLSGVWVSAAMLQQLASSKTHPGRMISYRPDFPRRDPIGTDACAPIATPLARTTHRFTLDSQRQIARVSAATEDLNGQLMGSEAERLLACFQARRHRDSLPRDVVIELNTSRVTSPIYWPGDHLKIQRPDLSLENLRPLFDELAALDDVRITFGGVGDPLLRGDLWAILATARNAGIRALAVETDLLGIEPARVSELAESAADVVCVSLPAVTARTYREVCGIDGIDDVLRNVHTFVQTRQKQGRGVPLLVPVFVKCAANLAEMEVWYDQWLTALNSAVITGPTDFAGLIPDAALADMAPPKRSACYRLASRLTVLSDGRIVTCEQDVLGRQPLGELEQQTIGQAWQRLGEIRADHLAGNWNKLTACASCREWHRG